ncbi:MAG TPA: peptidoglycan DD-metalloendopeptidase family protein [Marmoricola sp.]|nr:peptidoglycan DD-metalloendopeptidase family protein [Marmoricola sp.]
MVRNFPATTRQRILAAAIAFAVATAPAAAPIAHADDLKHKKHKVEQRVKAARADLEDSSQAASQAHRALHTAWAQLHQARATLAVTRGKLVAAQALDKQRQHELVQAEVALSQARDDLRAGREKVKEQQRLLAQMASESMQQADPQLIGLWAMLKAQNPSDLTTQLKTVGNLVDRETTALDQLKTERTLLTVKERKVEDAKVQVEQKRKAAAENLVLRQGLEKKAAEAEDAVTALVQTRRTAQDAALRAKHADERTLRKSKREARRISRMLAARAHHSVDKGNHGPLMRPVTGYVTSAFGWRRHPIYGYWGLHDGTDFHAPCGTPLRAAGNGRVISEYFQSAWGNRLILDLGRVRGHGVAVIYNHISAYSAHTGQSVRRGETVAYAGTTGWSTACHLHFTVMVDGQPRNPMDWF